MASARPPVIDVRPAGHPGPFLSRFIAGTDKVAKTCLQAVGTAGAYVREIPLVGAVAIEPLAYMGRNIEKGYTDTRTIRAAKRAMKKPETARSEAEKILTPEQRADLRNAAGATA